MSANIQGFGINLQTYNLTGNNQLRITTTTIPITGEPKVTEETTNLGTVDTSQLVLSDEAISSNDASILTDKLDTNQNGIIERKEVTAGYNAHEIDATQRDYLYNVIDTLASKNQRTIDNDGNKILTQNNGASAIYADSNDNITKKVERTESREGENIKYTYTITLYDSPERGDTTVKEFESSIKLSASKLETFITYCCTLKQETITHEDGSTTTKTVSSKDGSGFQMITEEKDADGVLKSITKTASVTRTGKNVSGSMQEKISFYEDTDGTQKVKVESYKVDYSGNFYEANPTKDIAYYDFTSIEDYNNNVDNLSDHILKEEKLQIDRTTGNEKANSNKTVIIYGTDSDGNKLTTTLKTTYKTSGENKIPTTTFTQVLEQEDVGTTTTIRVHKGEANAAAITSIAAFDAVTSTIKSSSFVSTDGKTEINLEYDNNGNIQKGTRKVTDEQGHTTTTTFNRISSSHQSYNGTFRITETDYNGTTTSIHDYVPDAKLNLDATNTSANNLTVKDGVLIDSMQTYSATPTYASSSDDGKVHFASLTETKNGIIYTYEGYHIPQDSESKESEEPLFRKVQTGSETKYYYRDNNNREGGATTDTWHEITASGGKTALEIYKERLALLDNIYQAPSASGGKTALEIYKERLALRSIRSFR